MVVSGHLVFACVACPNWLSGYAGRGCYVGFFVRAFKLAWILFQNL
jgi:hypothetical protein